MSDNPAPGKPAPGIKSPQPDPGTLSTQPDPGLLDPAQNIPVPGHRDADNTEHNAARQRTRTLLGQELYKGKVHDFLRKIDKLWRKMEDSLVSVENAETIELRNLRRVEDELLKLHSKLNKQTYTETIQNFS
jgi:hypothetical protein